MRLSVCARACELLRGLGGPAGSDRVRAWVAAHPPRDGAEADFVASLVVAADGHAQINAAYSDAPAN